jgi:hypothetical protein
MHPAFRDEAVAVLGRHGHHNLLSQVKDSRLHAPGAVEVVVDLRVLEELALGDLRPHGRLGGKVVVNPMLLTWGVSSSSSAPIIKTAISVISSAIIISSRHRST